jgi:hypothetical protein
VPIPGWIHTSTYLTYTVDTYLPTNSPNLYRREHSKHNHQNERFNHYRRGDLGPGHRLRRPYLHYGHVLDPDPAQDCPQPLVGAHEREDAMAAAAPLLPEGLGRGASHLTRIHAGSVSAVITIQRQQRLAHHHAASVETEPGAHDPVIVGHHHQLLFFLVFCSTILMTALELYIRAFYLAF